ncbi:MAG: M20/M25/M40 family metallo-hydrolase [Pyrinomonadaceae bacterium]
MRIRSFSFVLVLSFSLCAIAQQPSAVEQNLRKHVSYLASDQLEGRRTGENGATYAAGYIANGFANYRLKAGIRSAKTKPNFLQPFPYVAGVALGANNALRIIPAGATKENKMETGVNWMPLGYSPDTNIPSTPIVFAGYGISSKELNYDDYAGLDVRDRIVLILDGTPDPGPHSLFGLFNTHRKANIARDKGACALIIIASEPDFKNDRLSRLVYDRTLGETAVPVVAIMRSQGAAIIGAKDEKELSEIEKWISLKKDAPSSIQIKLADPLNATAELRIDLEKRKTEAYNVIGILEGRDPILKNEAIVIGAHYDHLGRGGQGSLAVNSSDIHHGADDNASGTSAILELARLFAKEKENKRTIIFIAFGGEEEGLLGSKYYVDNPVWPLNKTVAMINLDMVGRLKEEKLTVGGIGTASEWKDLVNAKNAAVGIGHLTNGSAALAKAPLFALQLNQDGFGPSDHSSFYGKQIPVLFFFTGTHIDYHKPSDTAEKINYEGLAKITEYVSDLAHTIDQSTTKPTYTVARSSGVMGGRTGFSVSLGTVPSYADSTDGLVLDGVRDDSAAAKAGIKPGDKIVKLAGKEVRNAMDYTYVLGDMKAGEEYEVELLRGSEKLILKIVPAPAAPRP